MRLRSYLAAAALLSASLTAHADYLTTIDFNGLTGPNNSTFTSYMEGGFLVSSAGAGVFNESTTNGLGNPLPDIYTDQNGAIRITFGGDAFSVISFDLGFYTAGAIEYRVVADYSDMRGATSYTATSSDPTAQTFVTVLSPIPTLSLESFYLAINTTAPTAALDNIVVSFPSAPEPSSFALLGTGLLGLAGAVRRRFA